MNDKYIVYFISRTKEKMVRFIEAKLKELGLEDLAASHGNILTVLFEHGGKLPMTQIAQKIGKDKSTVTALINKLSQLGYISKLRDEKDKRVCYIVLTQKAYQIKPDFDTISAQVHATAYKDFSSKDKEVFLSLLKRLNFNFTSKGL